MNSTRLGHSIDVLLNRAAMRSEVALSLGRGIFCALVLIRFASFDKVAADLHPAARTAITYPVVLLPIVYSTIVVLRWWYRRPLHGWFTFSTFLDVFACIGALLPNSLFPHAHYEGALAGPDIYVVLLIVAAAGLRLSVRLAMTAGSLAALGVAALVLLDLRSPIYRKSFEQADVTMFLVLLIGATTVATIVAWRTRRLVFAGAAEARKHERVREELESILQDHHDAQSLLGAIILKSERMLARERTIDLREDLSLLRNCLRQVCEKAVAGNLAARDLQQVELNTTVRGISQRLAAIFSQVVLKSVESGPARVSFVDGSAGLHRVLHNLVKNAADGDGRRGATRIEIRVTGERDRVLLIVDDDGPGIEHPEPNFTTKRDGLGVGLAVVHKLVAASGGQASLLQSPLGGLRVALSFPIVGGLWIARQPASSPGARARDTDFEESRR